MEKLTGKSIGRYQVKRLLGGGGMGVVYCAFDPNLQREVAIKVMREGPFAGWRDRARFDREVQILSTLKHPSIVSIHDSGVASGSHYFVMDYISGQPLDVFKSSGPRSIPNRSVTSPEAKGRWRLIGCRRSDSRSARSLTI
jgi:serine/threonine protein kinase